MHSGAWSTGLYSGEMTGWESKLDFAKTYIRATQAYPMAAHGEVTEMKCVPSLSPIAAPNYKKSWAMGISGEHAANEPSVDIDNVLRTA
jgi:hypothetical protein